MKKRIVAFVLAGILCFCGITALAQTEKSILTVLSVTYTQEQLEIICHVTGEVGQITCLVYSLTEKGQEDTLLQVREFNGTKNSVVTLTFSITEASHGYGIRIGGEKVMNPRKITLLSGNYEFPYLPYVEGQTAGTVKKSVAVLGQVALLRGQSALEDSQTVTPGDVVGVEQTQYLLVRFGDVDADGRISAKDALQILRHSVQKITLTDMAFVAANWGQDDKIDAADALAILKFAVGKTDCL